MSNPYVFPPFGLVDPVLKFLYNMLSAFLFYHSCSPVNPLSYWWPELITQSQSRFLLGGFDAVGVLLAPSTREYMPATCPCPLWASGVSRL